MSKPRKRSQIQLPHPTPSDPLTPAQFPPTQPSRTRSRYSKPFPFCTPKSKHQDQRTTKTHILLINLSLLTGLPFFPLLFRGVSVHISLTFSSTILQCLSKALTLASSLRLLRHEIRTWVCERTAVCRMDSGPDVNSCSSSWAISNSL